MIPNAAIEAVARILANAALFDADIEGYGWDAETDSSDHFMPGARNQARHILEAAAPHMLAGAWDEGHERGFWNGRMSQLTRPHNAPAPPIGKSDAEANNPYRPIP